MRPETLLNTALARRDGVLPGPRWYERFQAVPVVVAFAAVACAVILFAFESTLGAAIAIGVAAFALASINWAVGMYAVAAIFPFEFALVIQENFTATKAAALVALWGLVLRVFFDRQLQQRAAATLTAKPVVYFAGLVVLIATSYIWATDKTVVIARISTMAGCLLLMVLASLLDVAQLRRMWSVLLISAVISVPFGFLSGQVRSVADRLGTGGMNANDYGGVLAMLMFIAVFATRSLKIASAVLLVGVVLTQSRASLLAAAVATCAIVVLPGQRTRAKYAFIVGAFLVVALAAVFVVAPEYAEATQRRFTNLESDGNWISRQQLRQTAVNTMVDNPLLGVGAGNYYLECRQSVPFCVWIEGQGFKGVAHNAPLELGAELGFPGLLLWCLTIGSSFMVAWRLIRNANGYFSRAATGLFGAFVVYNLASLATSIQGQKTAYLIMGSLLALEWGGTRATTPSPAVQPVAVAHACSHLGVQH